MNPSIVIVNIFFGIMDKVFFWMLLMTELLIHMKSPFLMLIIKAAHNHLFLWYGQEIVLKTEVSEEDQSL